MLTFIAVAAATASLSATAWYIYLAIKRDIHPVLAGWIIMALTQLLGVTSYWLAPKHSVTGGIGPIAGAVSAIPILIVVSILQRKRHEGGPRFDLFQKACLAIAAAILVVWIILRFRIGGEEAATDSNILNQLVLATVSYVPMAVRLWKAKRNTESLIFWSGIWTASVLGLLTGYLKDEWLSMIYGGRALATTSITILLIMRLRRRARRAVPS